MAAIDRLAGLRGGMLSGKSCPGRRVALGLACAALMISAPQAWCQASGQAEQQHSVDALHRALNLSQGQEAAWQAYRAQAIAPSQAQDRRQAAAQMFPKLNAPQRMDLVEAEMKQELADLQRQAQALRVFYQALSPAQQTVFDAQTLPRENGQREQDQ